MSGVMSSMTDTDMTITQASKHFDVSERTIRRWIECDKLTASKFNGHWKIKLDTAPDIEPDILSSKPDTTPDIMSNLSDQVDRLITDVQHLRQQLETKDLQIDKLQQALDQEQQLHAVSQKTIESKQLQIEDMSRNRSILARIREVFIPSNT